MDKHELVKKLKELALETGQTPTRDEFCKHIKNGKNLVQDFGGMSALVQASGLAPIKKRKVTNAIFERTVESVLENSDKPMPIVITDGGDKVLVIGDCHFPWVKVECLQIIYAFAEIAQPDFIIQIGDLYDLYAHAKFPRSLNIYTPRDELALARSMASDMWAKLAKICPNAKRIQILGNHDVRPLKRVIEAVPAVEDDIFKSFCDWFSFDGVEFITDSRQEVWIGETCFIHGYRSKLGDQMAWQKSNVVTGHSHRGGVIYRNQWCHSSQRTKIIYELNAGYVGDPASRALGYRAQKIDDWTWGFGFIDAFGPRFIPIFI